jgi:hypothetical protein
VSFVITPKGCDPALDARTLPLPKWFAHASAIWLRQELPTQTNKIFTGKSDDGVIGPLVI